ncbi:metal-dependent transcriptional regulator [Brachybacterium sp. AOP25-B2-12]|uniref:metal-dependent transcriptional regulator n=1 Tax=Brachybacterium sp. AOP25-B2-12 TaxID=3457710 RepID=UPI0040334388
MSTDLIDTTEMYLKTVFELEEAGIPPMRARIAERLRHSGPTVSQTVARMERDDLLHLDEERHIHLTPKGAAIAKDVMRKHRLAERHLLDTIGLDYAHVHEEACRWEHVMSAEVEQRIAHLISPPYLDPYGNPIPGLDELGIDVNESGVTPVGQDASKALSPLGDLDLSQGPVEVVLDRIGERAQSDVELLQDLAGHGVVAGAPLAVERVVDEVRLRVAGHDPTIIPRDVVGQLTVRVGTAR